MENTEGIQWPALIKYCQDDELAYISNEKYWRDDPDFSHFEYDELDYLLDVTGRTFRLTEKAGSWVIPVVTSKVKTRDETIELVKKHASQLGFCCMSKLYANSIEEAVLLVASIKT